MGQPHRFANPIETSRLELEKEHTIAFLQQLAQWHPDPGQQNVIIWDGASWHSQTAIIRQEAERLDFKLIPLPGYSPDLNPIEG